MNRTNAVAERLEVYRYAWPLHIWLVVWSAVLAVMPLGMLFDTDFRESLSLAGFLLVAALGVYGLFVMLCGYFVFDKFRRFSTLAESPQLVVDLQGIRTKRSFWQSNDIPRSVPWSDIQGFTVGTRSSRNDDESPPVKFPCVLVSNVKRYQRWNVRWKFFNQFEWKPSNALPLPNSFSLGYLVRRDPLEPLDQVDRNDLVGLLNDYKRSVFASGVKASSAPRG